MPPSSKHLFLVAKFAIEDAAEGADKSNSAPPRLSSTQTTSASEIQSRFGMNPFSLSQISLFKSHTCTSSSQHSVNSISFPASVSSPLCIYSSKSAIDTSNISSSTQSSHSHARC